jgi:hypothetical protein
MHEVPAGSVSRSVARGGVALALLSLSACSSMDDRELTVAAPGGAGSTGAGAASEAAAAAGTVGVTAAAGGTSASSAADRPSSAGELPAASADASALTPGAGLDGSAPEPGVRFVGRFDGSDPAGPRFAWSGSGILARFSGTAVGVRLAGGQQYTVLIDGVEQPKLVSSGDVDPLAGDLPPGEHLVELYRRTEANEGEAQFLGFELGAGALLAPPPAAPRRIEIIGDSISCGYGVEGADASCPFTADTENHYLTYGAIAARDVGAELVTVAWSGKGLVCNYGDEETSCVDPMPVYFDRTLPEQADSVWDFDAYQPQAVVINLGTNDFSTDVDPSAAEFEAAYVSLLERVRDAYPAATVFCTVGPLLAGADLATVRAAIEGAAAARAAAGDTRVEVFELAERNPNDGAGCDYHPSPRTHEIMAEALTSALSSALDW